jgi:hypothetical protein
MRLNPKEPNFTASTILLGEEIAQQLIESARRSRPKWVELFQEHAGAIPQLKVAAQSRLPTFHHPLVSEFILEWARNTTWGVCDSGCSDAIGVNVPSIHIERLAESRRFRLCSVTVPTFAPRVLGTMTTTESSA